MPIKKQKVAAVFVSGPCDTPAKRQVFAVGGRQVAGIPYIAPVCAGVGGGLDYLPPFPVFIVR
jgi:hypothetical protein